MIQVIWHSITGKTDGTGSDHRLTEDMHKGKD